jgi:hypothetical protein
MHVRRGGGQARTIVARGSRASSRAAPAGPCRCARSCSGADIRPARALRAHGGRRYWDALSATAPEKSLVPYSAGSIPASAGPGAAGAASAAGAGEATGAGPAAGGPWSKREPTESRSFWMLPARHAGLGAGDIGRSRVAYGGGPEGRRCSLPLVSYVRKVTRAFLWRRWCHRGLGERVGTLELLPQGSAVGLGGVEAFL